MSASPDNFESLEKLLRLKRHEQPPPRYFNEFSGRVMGRIERGDARLSWWERFGFDLRPALAAGAGMVACGLIVYGVATADDDVIPTSDLESLAMATGTASSVQPSGLFGNSGNAFAANSTNPVPGSPRRGLPLTPIVFPGQ